MLSLPAMRAAAKPTPAPVRLQRACACGARSAGTCASCERKKLQRRSEEGAAGPATAPPLVHDVLAQPGRPLDASTRASLGPRMGHDFSRVRIHDDARAAESARAVHALAYTVGHHVVFAEGRRAGAEGNRLLAHELAHVAQQAGGTLGPGPIPVAPADDAWEREAERVAQGAAPSGERGPGAPRLQRAPDPEEERVDAGTQERDPAPAQTPTQTPGGAQTPPPAAPKPTPVTRTFALTFDDGPHAAPLGAGANLTEKVLDVLRAKGIKGAFFVQTGVSYRGASANGKALIARMHKDGHKVGIHTGGAIDHQRHTEALAAGTLGSELASAKTAIHAATGATPDLVRPPEGVHNKAVDAAYAAASLNNLMWDMDIDQGKNLPLATLLKRTETEMAAVAKGGWKPSTLSPQIVVLYHDIQKNTANNLDALIEHLKKTCIALGDTPAFAPP